MIDRSETNEFERILADAKSSDHFAMNRLLVMSTPYIKVCLDRMFYRDRSMSIDRSDIVQEVLMKVFRDLHKMNGTTKREYFCWIGSICRHTTFHAIEKEFAERRSCRRSIRLSECEVWDQGQEFEPIEYAIANETEAIATDVVQSMSKGAAKIVLQMMDGWSLGEIAERSDCTIDSVYAHVKRFRKRMREVFEEMNAQLA